MAFRTLEITGPAEIHLKKGQMEITKEAGAYMIPLEDIATIVCNGAGIRISTMALSQIAGHGITLMTIDAKYHPSCVSIPFESNVRQALVLRKQINMTDDDKYMIWSELIRRKIENQARVLAMMGSDGAEKVMAYSAGFDKENIDLYEAKAAKTYFYQLHPGLNRDNDNPVNSNLNYGYAVVRNAIIRAAILAGFNPSIGIHHDNRFNSFNLADDFIEPWRPMVDLVAVDDPGTNTILGRARRKKLAMVLHNACLVNGVKMSVLTGIEEMIGSIRNKVVYDSGAELKLPVVIPPEALDPIVE